MHIHKKIIKFTCLTLLLNVITTNIKAQEISDYTQLSEQEFENFTLPCLSVLFENAKNSPTYQMRDVNAQMQQSLLKKQKKDFFSFFSLRGSYQYGRFTNDNYYSDVYTPAITSFSNQSQNLYSIGAGITIPLDKLFDMGASVRRQKLAIRSAELERDMHYDELKLQIIDCYTKIGLELNNLKINNENLVQATAAYSTAEKNFVIGRITPGQLAEEKQKQSMAKMTYETGKNELLKNLLTLELISHTSFIKK